MFPLFDGSGATGIVHLAAQAGVRFSLEDPWAYVSSNVMGHVTVLEAARRLPRLEHLVYASSSSVYGGNTKLPFAEADPVDTPVSALCRDQARGRVDVACLLAPVRAAADRAALLHGLWAVGPAGHGLLQLRRGDPGRAPDHALRRRPAEARLHLYRRHRGRRAGVPRPAARVPGRSRRCSISATTAANTCPTSWRCWRSGWAARRWCERPRGRWRTSPRPAPTSTRSGNGSATRRRRRWTSGIPRFLEWFLAYRGRNAS